MHRPTELTPAQLQATTGGHGLVGAGGILPWERTYEIASAPSGFADWSRRMREKYGN